MEEARKDLHGCASKVTKLQKQVTIFGMEPAISDKNNTRMSFSKTPSQYELNLTLEIQTPYWLQSVRVPLPITEWYVLLQDLNAVQFF